MSLLGDSITASILSADRKRLGMLPGPTYVPESVMDVMKNSNIYHRSEEFHTLFNQIQEDLKYVFKTDRSIYVLTSSGTGGLEAIVSNYLRSNEKVLVVVNGYFSQELASVLEAYKIRCSRLEVDWKSGVTADVVHSALKKDSEIKSVAIAHVETSTGSRAPLKELSKVCEEHGVSLIVDAESAVGGEEFRFDEWNLGAVSAGTQKCICSPPGLALVSLNEQVWDEICKKGKSGFYFDLQRYQEYSKKRETPFTPAIPLFFALRESLRLIREEGIENRIRRHSECSERLRDGLKSLGLHSYIPLEFCSNVCTAVDISEKKIPSSEIVRRLSSEYGIDIASGIGSIKEQIIRIGTMGTVSSSDIDLTLDALRKVL